MSSTEQFQQTLLKATAAAPALANAALLQAKGSTTTYLQVLTSLYKTNHLPLPDFTDILLLNTEVPGYSVPLEQHSIITPSTSCTDTVEFGTSLDDEIKAFNNHFYHITVSSPDNLSHSYEFQEQNTFTSLDEELQAFNENYLMMTESSPNDWEDWFDEKSGSTFSTSSPNSSYEWLDYSPVSIAESTGFQLVTLEVVEPSQSITYSDLTIVGDYNSMSSNYVVSTVNSYTKYISKKVKPTTKLCKAPVTSTPFIRSPPQSRSSKSRKSVAGPAKLHRARIPPLTVVTPPSSSSRSSSPVAPSLTRTINGTMSSNITTSQSMSSTLTSSNTWIVVPTPSPGYMTGRSAKHDTFHGNNQQITSNIQVHSLSKQMSPITSSSLPWKRCRTQLF